MFSRFANSSFKIHHFNPWKRFASTANATSTTTSSAAVNDLGPPAVNHWKFERFFSAALIPLCAIPFVTGPSKVTDFLLTFVLPIHCHWGMEQIVIDYLNARKIGNIGNKVVMGGLYAATGLTIYGLFLFNTRDVGITQFLASAWNPHKKSQPEKSQK